MDTPITRHTGVAVRAGELLRTAQLAGMPAEHLAFDYIKAALYSSEFENGLAPNILITADLLVTAYLREIGNI